MPAPVRNEAIIRAVSEMEAVAASYVRRIIANEPEAVYSILVTFW